MHLDVTDLRQFYYRTRLGRSAQRAIRDEVVRYWPDVTGQFVAGMGFAVPLLRPLRAQARHCIALMPGAQGVMPWPAGEPNHSVLCEETLWPLQNGAVDRLIMLHALETSIIPGRLLQEAYRVLGPGGRAMFIVPNRAGIWARSDRTPFGFGRPYSLSQLEQQLRDYDFKPQRHSATLFQPVSDKPFWLRAAPMLERVGRKVTGRFAGGVLIVEACKQIPARAGGQGAMVRKPKLVLDAPGQPVPSRVTP
ncbi:methyltransferase domain-containing protein [Palleronia caenipelagi]|uniref:Class I SAM-dependent methyltransferase n=1 Tax=Palleronia caenipelagi TaxID=2489174 RepID=A0A547PRB8_9RHOB|nr:methyltransferase domain-containing protein [Palleronia caenipelagi]TRD16631.1 class I SAM-dependent methyltransferase [Palleronia caenipelagi]